ncbi:uncharacterized protein LOC119997711 [Tripterygium wilfordii]|uniref:uncharacterized protein LOC119997711 n=1 Tax=Tripterygium wilfordii TaxID=458696 RepID=UPI0018F830A4|nr:uncharacterized protein LOC119997711 [Tripterygium wilfordii]XP_038700813.1 uncharacterized protein LOC119997711 [Tripterygium wilfordii]XP_038700814.1 uncharacterized protein LOC119997711 [Tripterygium wilfordii]XP_038700815.1 uncharacterized protein LOC119997711 [Tripterygium wilfordii]
MEMGSCEDPGEVWHEAALGQDSIMGFVQSHDSELPFCLKADLELTGINVAPPEMQNGFGELLFGESAGCVSYDYTERAAANNKDCRVGECANVAVPILEKVLDDENGAVRDCLNESRVEISNCFLKKEGLCTEKAGLQGKHELVISIQTHETPVTHLKRDFFEAKEQKDANGVNGPSSKGLVEEKSDSLAVMESNTRDHLSVYREMPVEHQSMDGPSHCPEQDCLQDDKLVSCTSTKRIMKVIEEEHDALVGTETLCGDESVPPEGCEMPSDSMFADYSPKQHIQLDEHKCNKCMGSPHVDGFIWVSEERSGVLVGANSFSCKPILPSESAEVSTTCLATKSIQQGEQKDDKFIDCPFVEGAMEVKEVMIFNDQILPSYHCEILSESMPVTILSKNCDEENVLDTRIFRGLDSNTDVPYQIEAHSCNWISLPEGDEMHIKSLEGDLESSGWHDNQKSETGDSDPYTKTSAKGVEIKNCARTCVHVFNPQYEQSNDKHVSGPSVESNSELLEGKNDSKADVTLELCSQLSCIDQNDFNSEKGFFGMAANGLLERPTSLQLTGCPGVVEHSSFTSLDVKDCLRRSVFGAIDSVSAVDSSGQEDNKEISILKIDQVSEINFSENITFSSPRRNRTRKSSQKSKGKKAATKHRGPAKVPHQHEILEYILKSPKRKRSHFSRLARCALWGSMGNITQLFKQSNGLGLDYVLNQESLKSLGARGSGMRNKSGKGGSSRRSSRKSSASTGVLRLKVKVGSENCHQSNLKNVIPKVLETSASAEANFNNSVSDCCLGGSIEPSKSANGIKVEWGEEVAEKELFSVDKYLENAKTELDVDSHGANCECSLIPDKLGRDGANLGFASHMMVEALGGTIDRTLADPGTSPDSEVTIVPDAEVVTKPEEESNGSSYCGAVARNKKGKKKANLPYVGADIIKTAKPLENGGGKQKLGDRMSPSESLTSSTIGTASSISSSNRDVELLSLPRETEIKVAGENLEVKICVEDEKCCDLDGYLGLSESENSLNMLYSANSERVQPAKSLKPEGLRQERSRVSGLVKSREGSAPCKRRNKQKSVNKVKENTTLDHAAKRVEDYPESGKHIADVIGGNNVVSINNLDMASGGVIEQSLPVESAWVSCDDCHKWRRISDALVNSIDESSPWSCKDNMDKAFADCTIPQEKSNADINAELGILDADEDIYDGNLKGSEYKHITVSQESSFKRIDANVFPHRSRRNQTIDEVMVCHCKPPQDGWLGCGDQCLNRMLNIECVQGTCPCGDICSNQQFQKRQCAGMKWVRCGKKGFGLQLQEDISKGQFLIEYVGEVLDMHAYEARQREYAAKGHKHFYFMTLNGGEVIDACAKGNLGRFINHSCDPNCRTEKWMVNGEICIGLFAIRDIKKGEEVTFDYNYVRVFGAAVKKCYCGSLHCRGYIGGETHNAEVIVQGDSDEEFPEPVMLEDGKTGVHLKGMRRRTNSVDNDMKSVEVPVLKSDVTAEIGDAINLSASATSQPHSSPELEASKRNSLCSSQPVEVSPQTVSASKSTSHAKEAMPPENTLCSVQVLEKSFSVDVDASRKSKSETVKGKRVFSKSRFLIKTSHGSIKKGKVNGNLPNEDKVQMIANKPQVLSVRPKKLVEGSSDGRFEAVEEKLNELLDANGGISKRKEAPKGYLKLLLLTAASGGSGNGEAIQSNRDLSMILDALLKTKSRVVLVDIINKNGLRMLHNIMKQYRRDFKKIPILRKLLKVLEFLATREILAFDHINGGPPCPGMESFRESMLSLTEHDDKQVHQIARHFRDRWISKFVRKTNCLDRDDGGMEFHRGSGCVRVSGSHNNRHDDVVRSTKAIDCIMQSVPVTTSVDGTVQEGSSTGGCKTNDAKTRKRKSRWDQPAEPKTNMGSSVSPNTGVVDHLEEVSREDDSCLEYIHSQCQENEAICAANGGINSHEDVPPGFSSPLNPTMVSSSTSITPQSVGCLSCPLEVVVGNSQGKFISRLPMSYGIPLPIVQQIGSPDNETLGSWFIAPGMPFHPFPPLPPYPRDTKSTPHCAVKSMATNELPQQVRKDNLDNIGCYPHENNHGTSFRHQSEANFQVANVQQTCKRARGSSYDLSKKYYRQKKWNNVPPWLRRSMEWGYVGNNLGGGTCSVDVGNMTNESRSPYCTQDLNHGVEKAGCYYNPRLHHQNQH